MQQQSERKRKLRELKDDLNEGMIDQSFYNRMAEKAYGGVGV